MYNLKKDTTFINSMKVITLRIAFFNAIYSVFVVLKAISVCNLLHYNTGHSTYIITYPVCNMTFSALE